MISREESLKIAIKRSSKMEDTLCKMGGYDVWLAKQGKDADLGQPLSLQCDAFAEWVSERKEGVHKITTTFAGAWAYFYENYKDWGVMKYSRMDGGKDTYSFHLDT